jgi:hypothetical protein
MIEAYLDESGIHDGAKLCVISGYFGGAGQMRKLEKAWKSVLAEFDFPLRDFHAKDLLKRDSCRPMLRRLARAIADQPKVHPITYGIVVDDFYSFTLEQRKFMTGATLHPRTGKLLSSGSPDKPYFVPFQNIVRSITDYAPVGGKAHFNFGLDRVFAGYALALFSQITEQSRIEPRPWSTWKTVDRLGIAQFPKASDTPQLQAADLLVHLTYLHMNEWLEKGNVSAPSELLRRCLANSRSQEDHKYQDKECLQKFLEESRKVVANWDSLPVT